MTSSEPARSPSTQELLETGRWRISRESYPVDGRKQLLEKITEALNGGRVQSLVVRVGEPLRVERLVPVSDEDVPVDGLEDDLVASLRNSELVDLPGDDQSPAFDQMVRAFNVLAEMKASPVFWVVANTHLLRSWVDHPELNLGRLLGVPVRYHQAMPDDAIVLAGSTDPSDPFQSITHAVRIPVRTENAE